MRRRIMCVIDCDIIEALAMSAGGVVTAACKGGRKVLLCRVVWHAVSRDSMLPPDKASAFSDLGSRILD